MFAIVPTMTPTLASAPFFAQQKVPFIGWGISTGFCQNPYALAFTGCIVPPPNIKTTGTTWGAMMDAAFKKQGVSTGRQGQDGRGHLRGQRLRQDRYAGHRGPGEVRQDEGRLRQGCAPGAAGGHR